MAAPSYVGNPAVERAVTPSRWSQMWSQNAPGYLFLLPWFIGFFGLTLGPILTSLYLSFTDFDLLTSPDWVGAACMVIPSYGGNRMTPGVGCTLDETMPGISLVPLCSMASPSEATPTPNMPPQASMAPTTTGVPAQGRPGRTRPAT